MRTKPSAIVPSSSVTVSPAATMNTLPAIRIRRSAMAARMCIEEAFSGRSIARTA
jgi:hypothetical protein